MPRTFHEFDGFQTREFETELILDGTIVQIPWYRWACTCGATGQWQELLNEADLAGKHQEHKERNL